MPIAKATHKPTIDIVANPRTEKGITPKQEEFARIYVCEDISQTEAAIRAGYSVRSAHAIASQLLNGERYPQVVARIRELKHELAKKYEVTFEGHVKKLAEIRDLAMQNGNYPAAVAAEKSRGQAILHGRIDQMDRDQVIKEIEKLQKEFPALAALADSNMLIEHEKDS